VDKGVRLSEGTKAVVRYEKLIGDRYLALEVPAPAPARRDHSGGTDIARA
jgi:phospholipid/cholesterol/gamma-HCH transport system substrate-binding protein